MARRRELAAEHLRTLLLDREAYRARWQCLAINTPPGLISQAAIAQVIANHLRQTGRAQPYRTLKDRIYRALSGKVLALETLELFATAFQFHEADVRQMQGLLTAPEDDARAVPVRAPGPGRGRGPVRVVFSHEQTRWLRAQLAVVHEKARAKCNDQDAVMALEILAALGWERSLGLSAEVGPVGGKVEGGEPA